MGYAMRGDLWEPQFTGLKANHQLAWFDHRGIGESTRGPTSRWTMGDMADDVLAVLDSLGWDSCHLVGVSMGGMVAQEVALRAPECVRSLTLIVTHAGGLTLEKLPTARGLRAFLDVNRQGTERRIKAMKTLLYPDEYLARADQDAMNKRMKQRMGRPLSRRTVLSQLGAITRHDTRSRLGALHVPTLIIKAGKDILVRPSASDRLQVLIPNARLLEIRDAGHGIIFQSANEVNRALADHLASAHP